MTTDDKYCPRNMQNFQVQFEAFLFQKKKIFFRFFFAFLKCAWNLEHFDKKHDYPSLVISKIIDSARGGYLIV